MQPSVLDNGESALLPMMLLATKRISRMQTKRAGGRRLPELRKQQGRFAAASSVLQRILQKFGGPTLVGSRFNDTMHADIHPRA